MVTPTHLPGMGHLQHAPPARPAYAHDITLQEVPNGPELGPNGKIRRSEGMDRWMDGWMDGRTDGWMTWGKETTSILSGSW